MSSSAITGPVLSDTRRAPSGTAAAPSFAFNDSTGTGVYLVSAGVLGLSTNGAQRVVVDASGNVGIGTASPGSRLDITDAGGSVRIGNVSIETPSASGLTLNASNIAGTLLFRAAGAERMRLDASGNLRIAPNSIQGATTKGFSLRSISTDGGTNSANTYCTSRYGAGKFVVLAAFDPSGNSVAASTAVGAGSTFIVLVTDAASNY